MSIKSNSGVMVKSVDPGGEAERAGIAPGCRIVSVNGTRVRDPLEYIYASSGEEELDVSWIDGSGRPHAAVCRPHDVYSGLELELAPVPVRTCVNRCPFCFVDQMPRGLRRSLYVKDDDWRSSFQYGTYVTLTNVSESEISRIIEQKVSPLYISVHASDDAVREQMLGTPAAARTFGNITRLARAGINVMAQVVVCEGINDGEILARTIDDLHALHPGVSSLSVVPVGLTQFRHGLAKVRPVSAENAGRIVDLVEDRQRSFLRNGKTRFVFAADELYLRSGRPLPPVSAYEEFEQLENGVGLVVDFENAALSEISVIGASGFDGERAGILLLTGEAFFPRLRMLADRISEKLPVDLTVRAVRNSFFGPSVTVAGLLTGHDVLSAIRDASGFDAVFVPDIMFRDHGERTLDDVSFNTIASHAAIPCFRANSDGDVFIRQIADFCRRHGRRS